jgi:AcrR family transcriptional regulator
MSLILKKRYEAISIQEICDAANVGRSTFYAHYRSKDDLHRRGLEHLRHVLLEGEKVVRGGQELSSASGLGFAAALFEHVRERKELLKALAGGRGGTLALEAIRGILAQLVRDALIARFDKHASDDIPRELITQYLVGAYLAVLSWWLDGGAKLPPGRIAEILDRLTTEGCMSRSARRG